MVSGLVRSFKINCHQGRPSNPPNHQTEKKLNNGGVWKEPWGSIIADAAYLATTLKDTWIEKQQCPNKMTITFRLHNNGSR